MNTTMPFGIFLFTKNTTNQMVLKELLQFVRTVTPASGSSFSYIEASSSLHPNLSLWENLQLESGVSDWKDFQHTLNPDQKALINLLKDPHRKGKDVEHWEKFLVSLVKGLISPSRNLLVDMNEELFSPFVIQKFKQTVLNSADRKTVFLASANTSLWLDCAHSIVSREEYKFQIQNLNPEIIRKHWAA